MKYLTEFRNGEIAQRMAREIHAVTTRPWKIMEVCGGQTHSIIKNGIDQMLPPEIEMVHGPGCPVCVTPLELIDKALAIASQPGVIFCSFGDMLRVPGTEGDLFQVKGARRRCARGLFAARCGRSGREKSGQAGGILRRRVRDHGPRQRHERTRGQAPRPQKLLAAGFARARSAGD